MTRAREVWARHMGVLRVRARHTISGVDSTLSF